MSKNLQSCLEKLKIISKINDPSLRKQVLFDLSDDCLYQALHEIALNAVERKIPFNQKTKRKLFKHKMNIKRLACPTSNKKKQRLLTIQSGGWLPLLIPAVVSILDTIIK